MKKGNDMQEKMKAVASNIVGPMVGSLAVQVYFVYLYLQTQDWHYLNIIVLNFINILLLIFAPLTLRSRTHARIKLIVTFSASAIFAMLAFSLFIDGLTLPFVAFFASILYFQMNPLLENQKEKTTLYTVIGCVAAYGVFIELIPISGNPKYPMSFQYVMCGIMSFISLAAAKNLIPKIQDLSIGSALSQSQILIMLAPLWGLLPILRHVTSVQVVAFVTLTIIAGILVSISTTHTLITQPLNHLTGVAERIASNDLSARAVVQRNNEFGVLGLTLNDAAEKLHNNILELEARVKERTAQLLQSEKLSAIGQMVAGVAHEVNSPRAAVDHYVTLTERQVDKILIAAHSAPDVNTPAKKIKQEYIPAMNLAVSRIGELTNGLLNFTRAEHKEMKSSDMHQIIDSVVVLLRSQLQGRIEIIKQYGGIPPVVCYPGQMNQVFMNILTNAIQAIPGTGTITITTAMNQGKVEIRIKDTGIGMDEETKKKIFDPFFTTKEVGKGTGLGMSIVWEILQKHGAVINIHSEQGKGTEFIIVIVVH